VFVGVLIDEEVDEVGDKVSGKPQPLMYRHSWRPYCNMSLRSTCFIDGAFFLAKTKLPVLGILSLSTRISRLPDNRL